MFHKFIELLVKLAKYLLERGGDHLHMGVRNLRSIFSFVSSLAFITIFLISPYR